MRRTAIIVISALLLLSCSCSATRSTEEPVIGMPNPFQEFTVHEEAEAHADFTIDLPSSSDFTLRVYKVIQNELFEAIYDGITEIRIRKAAGNEDISGDYNSYPQKRIVSTPEATVTFEGADGKVSKATWSHAGYSYSITAEEALEEPLMLSLVEGTF